MRVEAMVLRSSLTGKVLDRVYQGLALYYETGFARSIVEAARRTLAQYEENPTDRRVLEWLDGQGNGYVAWEKGFATLHTLKNVVG